jgi:primosomal protein N' (replication factor Y)
MDHDYKSFYEKETAARHQFSYPPFSRIIRITFKHKMQEIVHDAASVFALHLHRDFGNFLTGPGEPVIARIRNQFIMELMLKLPKNGSTIAFAKQVIQQQRAILQNDRKFRSVTVTPDIDPV